MPETAIEPQATSTPAASSGQTPSILATPPAPSAQTASWRDQIPEDLRTHPTLRDIKDLGGLAKSYIHAQQMIGVDKLPKPKDDWTKEQYDQFYNNLGRPPTPDKYQVPEYKLPEGFPKNDEEVKKFMGVFHEAGLTQKQAQAIMDNWMAHNVELFNKSNQAAMDNHKQEMEQLKKDFGLAYDERIKGAQLAVNMVADEGFKEWLNTATVNGVPLGNSPQMIKFLSNIGTHILEDSIDGSGDGQLKMTPGQAQQELAQMKMDENFNKMLLNKQHPGHEEAVKKFRQINRFIAGDGQVSLD